MRFEAGAARLRGDVRRARPLIAVSTSEIREAATTGTGAVAEGEPPRRDMVLGLSYLRAIDRVGGVPVVLPPLGPAAVEAIVERVDGVCLSGGPDIDPAAYRGADHPALGPTEPALDAFELALARAADERGLPILAICRGLQLLNVARGGTLHQHLPEAAGDRIVHRQADPVDRPTHWVRVHSSGRLAAILARQRTKVNSFHHQAAADLGHGLTPVAWAPDGTIEALEGVGERFVLAVQWHAEGLVDRPEQRALFSAFVDASAARSLGRADEALAG
ncbi:MAG: peptidase [Solirubrobacterales bacterium]|nr:peptidase [Solirubrobacterales bacterium]